MIDLRSLVPWSERRVSATHGPTTHGPTTHGDVFDVFADFRRDMDRMFENAFAGTGLLSGRVPSPRLDVHETDTAFVVTVELPGVDPTDVELNLSGDVLTIKGEKRQERESGGHLVERSYGAFTRAIRLPFEVEADGADASYDKGILTIQLPKPEKARQTTSRIEIKTG